MSVALAASLQNTLTHMHGGRNFKANRQHRPRPSVAFPRVAHVATVHAQGATILVHEETRVRMQAGKMHTDAAVKCQPMACIPDNIMPKPFWEPKLLFMWWAWNPRAQPECMRDGCSGPLEIMKQDVRPARHACSASASTQAHT